MIFQSNAFSATWDTWMFYHEETYYLYYLITEVGYGEGFGVATSTDGVHFTDHGMALRPSEKMRLYLGTGSVWKAVDFSRNKTFLCNYSEWRSRGEDISQRIYFAASRDLIQWEKCGDEYEFPPEERFYRACRRDRARWDTICPVEKPQGGYWGYWTAHPIQRPGFGFGYSEDGLRWTALAPPEFLPGMLSQAGKLELSAACVHNEKFYVLIGAWEHPTGGGVYTAESAGGPFSPAEKNFALFGNRTHKHAFFPRFFHRETELLCNFQVLLRRENEHGRPITFLAPLKKVAFDREGTLRLLWWEGNEAMKDLRKEDCQGNMILEGEMEGEAHLWMRLANGSAVRFTVYPSGRITVEDSAILEEYDRDLDLAGKAGLRFLRHGTLVELYVADFYVAGYTLESEITELRHDFRSARIWGLSF